MGTGQKKGERMLSKNRMIRHTVFVECSWCGHATTLHTGNADLQNCQNNLLDGQFLEAICYECYNEGENNVE
jgi:ribosomal protein S27E